MIPIELEFLKPPEGLDKIVGIPTAVLLSLAFCFVLGGIVAFADGHAVLALPLFCYAGSCGCASAAFTKTSVAGTAARENDSLKFNLRLMWLHQFQFIGIYRAEKAINSGVLDAKYHGITVNVDEGGSPIGLDPLATVSCGIDQLGVTSATSLIEWYSLHRTCPEEQKLVPLLVIFKKSPACLIYRVQNLLPAGNLSIEQLTGKRFTVPDLNDPVSREFATLCTLRNVRNIQYDMAVRAKRDTDSPIETLSRGGTADFRLGYTFNEGYRSRILCDRDLYSYQTLFKIFGVSDCYADVLFTSCAIMRDEKRGQAAKDIAKIIEESYLSLTDDKNRSRHTDIIQLMEEKCGIWWDKVRRERNQTSDSAAQELGELLSDAVSGGRGGKYLGERDSWRKLEDLVLHGTEQDTSGIHPHLQWIESEGARVSQWLG